MTWEELCGHIYASKVQGRSFSKVEEDLYDV